LFSNESIAEFLIERYIRQACRGWPALKTDQLSETMFTRSRAVELGIFEIPVLLAEAICGSPATFKNVIRK
jgi:hypothetical protein